MSSASVFGRVVTAMASPMHPDGSLDLGGAKKLAQHLVDHGHDGILVSGTTGESPTTTDAEKLDLLRAVLEVTDDRVRVTAGVGTNNTAHSVELATAAAKAGAHALLVVSPYYSKPPQEGVRAHVRTIADATDLPVMLYDIPGRTGIPFSTESLLELATHPNVQGVKDAKGDLWAASQVMAQTNLLWFSGDDVANLAHLTNGATGLVSVVGHAAGDRYAQMVAAVDRGDLKKALEVHRGLIPLVNAIMTPTAVSQGAAMVKAALKELGVIDFAAVRLPLVRATDDQIACVRDGLKSSGIT